MNNDIEKVAFTISEVAEILSVSVNTLRNYEKYFSIRIPHKRGGFTYGNRSYSQNAVKRLKYITSLLRDEGYTMKGAAIKYEKTKHLLK